MSERESVLWDAMLQAGYTPRQAARALVALTLPEPTKVEKESFSSWSHLAWGGRAGAAELEVEAERRGLLKEGT